MPFHSPLEVVDPDLGGLKSRGVVRADERIAHVDRHCGLLVAVGRGPIRKDGIGTGSVSAAGGGGRPGQIGMCGTTPICCGLAQDESAIALTQIGETIIRCIARGFIFGLLLHPGLLSHGGGALLGVTKCLDLPFCCGAALPQGDKMGVAQAIDAPGPCCESEQCGNAAKAQPERR